jgi:hypothetical protein
VDLLAALTMHRGVAMGRTVSEHSPKKSGVGSDGRNKRSVWRSTLLRLMLSNLAWTLFITSGSAQERWFVMRGMEYDWKGVRGHDDWERLFLQSHPNWPSSMWNVSVIQVTTQTLAHISDNDLRRFVNQLDKRGIALSVEMLAQAYGSDCGKNVEGFAAPASTASIAAKIKRVGGVLKFAAMDEPLWFGHYYQGPGQCRSSIPEVARRVAANIAEYKRQFSGLVVGDIEPVPALTTQKNWQGVYRHWIAEFRAAVGEGLGFLHIDIDWNAANWQGGVTEAMGFARQMTLPSGIIYNGSSRAKDTREWLESAYQYIKEIEDRLHSVPDHTVFQSWVRFPTRGIGNDSEPGQDSLLERYNQRGLRSGAH